jgi:transaldolase
MVTTSRLARLSRHGQSVWIDWLSRDLLLSGGLQKLIDDHGVTGVTTNPTILEHAIATSNAYDDQIERLLAAGLTPKQAFEVIAATDVRVAAEHLSPTWYGSRAVDGYVSWEVDPALAGNTGGTVAEVRRLHEEVPLPNVLLKIPATEAGIGALEDSIALGHSINVTLIFSLERYAAVVEAYLRGLRRAADAGRDLATIHSVASFFVSRLDTTADEMLERNGSRSALSLRGQLGIASAKLAHEYFQEAFAGPRWHALSTYGATPQRPLWASTSAKDPRYRDVRYVEELIGPGTVTTLPESTLVAFEEHGRVKPTLTKGVDAARRTLDALASAGVDLRGLTDELERDGIARFRASYTNVIDLIGSRSILRAA